MTYSEALAARVREVMSPAGEVEERKMFGGLTFMLNGHMCCGIVGDRLMVRLSPDQAEQALTDPNVRPMDFTERPMKSFLYVESEGLATDDELRHWLRLAQAYVATVPPK